MPELDLEREVARVPGRAPRDPEASPSQKYLAARVAVRLDDRGAAVDHLCAEATSGSPYALPAGNTLTRFGLLRA